MKCSRQAGLQLLLFSCVVAGCRTVSNPTAASDIADYEMRMSPGVTRSVAEPALRAALADPAVSAQVQRSGLVRVERVSNMAPPQAIKLEFQSYMSGHVVRLTNSVAGWRVASIGRMIE